MKTLFGTLLLGTVLALGAPSVASAAGAADPVVGTWTLNAAKSKFTPGPAPKSMTRTYAASMDGIDMTVTGVTADGKEISQHSTFKYDGKDYPFTGAADFDTLALKQVDSNTIESTQKKAGKVVAHTTRTVSKDGKVLTLSSKGTDAKGMAYDNVVVYDRK